eukprot:gene5968-4277_t
MSRCGTCDIELRSEEELRGHYSSELHLTNVRRRVNGQRPIKERDWVEEADLDTHQDPEGPPLFSCTLCQKTFRSVQTLQSHVRSTAHLMKKEERIVAREGEGTILTTTSIGSAAMGLHRRNKAKLKKLPEKNPNEVRVNPEDREEDTSETRCLFCGHPSEAFRDNLRHMELVHGFTIPMDEYCIDKEGFISYLSRKVNGLICLVCNEKTKTYYSLASLRDHMRECNHEKVPLTSEYQDFYECSLEDQVRPVKLFGVKGAELTVKTEGQTKKTIIKREAEVPRPRRKETEEMVEQRRAITANENSALVAAKEEQRRAMIERNGEVQKTLARSEALAYEPISCTLRDMMAKASLLLFSLFSDHTGVVFFRVFRLNVILLLSAHNVEERGILFGRIACCSQMNILLGEKNVSVYIYIYIYIYIYFVLLYLRNAVIVKDLRWRKHPFVEYHLIRVSNFYAQEQIFTVFPECKDFLDHQEKNGTKCNVYFVCTFQPNDGEVQSPTAEEVEDEKAAFESSLIKSDKISTLISYNKTSCVWKDASRLVFFEFLDEVSALLSAAFPSNDGEPMFFVDGPDPASGVALRTQRGPSTITESDILDQFFSFDAVVIAGAGGGCRMVQHPVFGLNVYPSSMVIGIPAAREEELMSLIRSMSTVSENV